VATSTRSTTWSHRTRSITTRLPGKCPSRPDTGPSSGGYELLFPDLHIQVANLVADGDDVAFAYTTTGTHQGPLMGHEPTGKNVSIRGMQISRFSGGKMAERWGSSDELGMLTQLGLA